MEELETSQGTGLRWRSRQATRQEEAYAVPKQESSAQGESPRLLCVLSCSKSKKFAPENQLSWDDFLDARRRAQRAQELAQWRLPAAEMYTGPQFLRAMEGVSILRERFGRAFVDVMVVSAGYGLIGEEEEIAPYDVTFSGLTPDESRWRGEHLGLPQAVRAAADRYPLTLFLLGKDYRFAADLPGDAPGAGRRIYLTGASGLGLLPEGSLAVRLGAAEMEAFGAGAIAVKGQVLRCFARGLSRLGAQELDKVVAAEHLDQFLRIAVAGLEPGV